jgi:hypothetical protein
MPFAGVPNDPRTEAVFHRSCHAKCLGALGT